MTDMTHFDYIIIGNGLAGLQLALKFSEDTFFDDKQIALIDPSDKTDNDKTWSFWDTDSSQWHSLIYKAWKHAYVLSSQKITSLKLSPYTYNSIKSIDFYNHAKTILQSKSNFHFILDEVTNVIENDQVLVNTKHSSYSASHVFDSRLPQSFYSETNKAISIIQHFKGWVIKTENDTFDKDKMVMMDYRLKDGNQTTFMYVLPFSGREALVEFTYFTEKLVSENTYDSFLKKYIFEHLTTDNYDIIETEMGQIPMTNYNFHKFNTAKITKIGTGGGWVKGSTGYSFKLTEKKVTQIVKNIKSNQQPSTKLFKRKYQFYDKVFLKVLKDENHKGEWLFQQFYSKNSTKTMFRFLDEESSFIEDLKVMSSLFSWTFIKAFFKTL